MSLSTFNRSNVVVMLLVVGAVLALFFLPEIIDLQRALSGDSARQKRSAQELAPEVQESGEGSLVSVSVTQTLSPLEEVLMLLDSGRDGRARAMIPTALDFGSSSVREGGMVPRASDGDGGTADVIETLGQSPLTWGAIQSESSAAVLRRARNEALQLAKGLGARSPNTRYALFNFASAIGTALDPKTPKVMQPEEVVGYLERLDLAVSRNMSREPIDRVDYLAWANISLGPVFEATRLGERKDNYIVPFQPQLTLTSIYVMHRRPDSLENKRQERVNVVATGFVRGKDARYIKIIGPNGNVRRRIGLPRAKADTDYRFFRTPALDGRQDWTFIVEGVEGERAEKTYRFYSKARRFAWGKFEDINQSGYLLPFRNVMATRTTFNPRDVDRRLDAFFAHGDIEGRSSNEVFQTF